MPGCAVSLCLLRVSGLGRQLPDKVVLPGLASRPPCLRPVASTSDLASPALCVLPCCWKLFAFAKRREFSPGPGSEQDIFAYVNRGQMCVPLLCPFSDLLKAASAPTERPPWHCSSASHMVLSPLSSAAHPGARVEEHVLWGLWNCGLGG